LIQSVPFSAEYPISTALRYRTPRERMASHGWPRTMMWVQSNSTFDDPDPEVVDTYYLLDRAHWYDIVVIDAETLADPQAQSYLGPNGSIRRQNPNTVVLAQWNLLETPAAFLGPSYSQYVYTQRIYEDLPEIDFLHLANGERAQFGQGAGDILNVTRPSLRKYLVQFLTTQLLNTPKIDGVFFDRLDATISYVGGATVDANNDGVTDPAASLDRSWRAAIVDMLRSVQQGIYGKIVAGNGGWHTTHEYSALVHGMMFENFLDGEEQAADYAWAGVMRGALAYTGPNSFSAIMANRTITPETKQADLKLFSLSAASACMVDAYSIVANTSVYTKTPDYWLDEYTVNDAGAASPTQLEFKHWLGRPQGPAWLPGASGTPTLPMALAQGTLDVNAYAVLRTFARGAVAVNPTEGEITLTKPAYWPTTKEISGGQAAYNDGSTVTSFVLPAKSGMFYRFF